MTKNHEKYTKTIIPDEGVEIETKISKTEIDDKGKQIEKLKNITTTDDIKELQEKMKKSNKKNDFELESFLSKNEGKTTINLDEAIKKIKKENKERINEIFNKSIEKLTEGDKRILAGILEENFGCVIDDIDEVYKYLKDEPEK